MGPAIVSATSIKAALQSPSPTIAFSHHTISPTPHTHQHRHHNMASRMPTKRKFGRFALDNEEEQAAGRTGPLPAQPHHGPAAGSWSVLAAFSSRMLSFFSAWSGPIRWFQRQVEMEERCEQFVGVDGPAVPGAWYSCPARFVGRYVALERFPPLPHQTSATISSSAFQSSAS